MRKYEYIQYAKGWAILGIALYHVLQRFGWTGMAGKAIIFGGTGVHLFFLLSGFGLAFSGAKDSVLGFYRRRLLKVWAPFALVLTLSWGAAAIWGLFPDGWEAWLAGVLGYQMFFEPWITSFGGHFWFISAIFQFYLVYPLLDKAYVRLQSHGWFFGLALLVSVCWWCLVWALGKSDMRTWNSCFLQFLWEFALGMVLAKKIKEGDTASKSARIFNHFWQMRAWPWWLLGGLAGALAMAFVVLKAGSMGPVFNDIPALWGYGMISVAVYFAAQKYWPALHRFLLWVGDFSYSFYLVHILVLETLLRMLKLAGYPPVWWLVPLFFACALLAGWFFERRVLRFILNYNG